MTLATLQRVSLLLACATLIAAQGPPSGSGGNSGNNPYSGGGDNSGSSSSSGSGSSGSGSGSGSSGSNQGSSGGGNGATQDYSQYSAFGRHIITAHAVLGTLAFAFFFPVGGILIRIGSFRGLWIAHAVIQILAYLFYIAAFGIGIWMTKHYYTLNAAHPILGIILFALLFFQPFLGVAHHVMFKKQSRRVVWSYGHIWLGRIIITLGIINGGLGLQLGKRVRFFEPSKSVIIGYSVAAAIMWLLYVASIVYGENKRRKAMKNGKPPQYKYDSNSDTEPGAPHGMTEYYKNQRQGQQYA